MQFIMQYIHDKTDRSSSAYFTEHACRIIEEVFIISFHLNMYTEWKLFKGGDVDGSFIYWRFMQNFWTLVDNI